ncbi:hypothetical protein BD626DRAFT_439970 [Schizophyllum amplum]|uniref:F-box domain-containing protein n=1 Tax=Schizophyllum amplum TaxID=97359 RepID=A0A550BX94_9AGAR|nr:hypothetical protein BD626DRAFT_439970 [Auriculariopsis ampla]
MQRLSLRRQEVARELDINHALLAPVHRLFPELLSEVFIHALQDPFNVQKTDFAVRVLCGVCTTWRAAARATPLLWTSIDLSYITSLEDPLLRLQLQLSGQLPLTVTAKVQDQAMQLLLVAFFDGMSDEDASRVVEITVEDDGVVLSQLRSRHLATLRVADVNIWDTCTQGELGFLTSAPTVHKLTIGVQYECEDDDAALAFPVPVIPDLPCLTHLILAIENEFPVSAFLPAISQLAPVLRVLKMSSFEVSAWEETKPTVTCEMHVLHTLELQHYTHRFLTFITAPVLHAVTLIGDDAQLGKEDPTESLLDLLTRSPCPPLRSFALHDPMQGSASGLLRCIELMEGLQRLSIEDNEQGVTSSPRLVAVLQRLVCDENTPPMLPELRSLSVQCRGDKSPCVRSDVAAPLSQVRLSRKDPRVCAGRAVAALE